MYLYPSLNPGLEDHENSFSCSERPRICSLLILFFSELSLSDGEHQIYPTLETHPQNKTTEDLGCGVSPRVHGVCSPSNLTKEVFAGENEHWNSLVPPWLPPTRDTHMPCAMQVHHQHY